MDKEEKEKREMDRQRKEGRGGKLAPPNSLGTLC